VKLPDTLETIQTDALIPFIRNSRTHSDAQVAQIAASIKEFGFTNPVLIDKDGGIIAGHARVMAARKLKMDKVPCIRLTHLSPTQTRALVIADNKLALNAGWDNELLALEFSDLTDMGFDLDLTGFTADEIVALTPEQIEPGLTDEDAVPDVPVQPVTVLGDVWVLGKHRLMCGDSTSIDAVEKLMDGKKAALLHADPPYGMGKEKDGVQNDNLYREDLDAFQMEWWATYRTFLEDNASAYIWGNAPDLWRLWYKGGLADSERMTMRNEIVWDKKHGQGMRSEDRRMFPSATERCLFFMLGEQGFNNNADNYWEGWEPIRAYLDGERKKLGWSIKDTKRIAGHSENSGCHWFDASQWSMPTKEVYDSWKAAAKGEAFTKDYEELEKEFYSTRACFDNTHDNMTDVWEFERVQGEERHGHATPKPVAMMERVMKSSLPKGGLCVEPFGGSGSTLIGAETTGRCCFAMELQPMYVDVIVKRWQNLTGRKAIHAETGKPFAEVSNGKEAKN